MRTAFASVTTGSTGRGIHMEGAGGSGRGSSGAGKCRSMHIGIPQESRRIVYCPGDDESRSAPCRATLLVNKSGSHRAVLPCLLSLVDGGNGAAHGLQISESLKIGQMPRRVGVKNTGQGVVVGQYGLHVVDSIDQVHGPVQRSEERRVGK